MELFGDKTVSPFDFWFFQHLATGIVLGWFLLRYSRLTAIFTALIIAYAWEAFEYAAELGIFGAALAKWFAGVEFVVNRFLVDPLTLILGVVLVHTFFQGQKLVIVTGTLAVLWLLANVVAPDTMTIQTAMLMMITSP